jgi:hypothetical protein
MRNLRMLGSSAVLATVSLFLLWTGCSPGSSGTERGAPAPRNATPGDRQQEATQGAEGLLVAPGHGTLLQDDITLRLQSGNLLVKVTPLEEWVIRLTAPDTYARLKGIADAQGNRAGRRAIGGQASLFLVSLFSYDPDVTYEPEDLLLVTRGLRSRPVGIAPITPSWGTQRLSQQETRMAVYAFDGPIDLRTDLVVEYQELRNDTWVDRILPRLEAERAKVRARGGVRSLPAGIS